MKRQFDLNIEKILDNWEIHHAIREIIANALDEMVLTKTKMITIEKCDDGFWHIKDFGRGLQYQHFTQNESTEKKNSHTVIGKFGVGLKDALAVFHKNNIYVKILSKYGDVELGMYPKEGFPDTYTLHALISEPTNDQMIGTEFILDVRDEDIEAAKSLFLAFSDRTPLENTEYGDIYLKSNDLSASIYVHGVKVAEESNYLFDYNITKPNTKLNKSLNRERSAVGRTAYSDLVKKMLLNAKDDSVIELLINELQNKIPEGTNCDEISLIDVQSHIIKIDNKTKQRVYISQSDALSFTNDDKEKIKESGKEIIVLPNVTHKRIKQEKDYNGNEIVTFSTILREYKDNFKYQFVDESLLTEREKQVLSLKDWVLSIYGNKEYLNKIYVSESINEMISGDTLGVYEKSEDRIILKRSILQNEFVFCEVLFHELVHAMTGYSDNERNFENALGEIIGKLCQKILNF